MGQLLRKFAAVASALIVAGCAVAEPVIEARSAVPVRRMWVQTIPRGAYVEVNGEYVGLAPRLVYVEATESGRPRSLTKVTATDTPSGAWVQEVLMPRAAVPERLLLDIRPWMSASPALSWR